MNKRIELLFEESRKRFNQKLDATVWRTPPEETNAMYVEVSAYNLIKQYAAVFAGEFQAWLGFALVSAKHEYTRFVLLDNLRCEMEENHVAMLVDFARLSAPGADDFKRATELLLPIRDRFSISSDSISHAVILASLEYLSDVFIPILGQAHKSLGNGSLHRYINSHGEADEEHASNLLKAVEKECGLELPFVDGYGEEDLLGEINSTLVMVENLLEGIFCNPYMMDSDMSE